MNQNDNITEERFIKAVRAASAGLSKPIDLPEKDAVKDFPYLKELLASLDDDKPAFIQGLTLGYACLYASLQKEFGETPLQELITNDMPMPDVAWTKEIIEAYSKDGIDGFDVYGIVGEDVLKVIPGWDLLFAETDDEESMLPGMSVAFLAMIAWGMFNISELNEGDKELDVAPDALFTSLEEDEEDEQVAPVFRAELHPNKVVPLAKLPEIFQALSTGGTPLSGIQMGVNGYNHVTLTATVLRSPAAMLSFLLANSELLQNACEDLELRVHAVFK